MKHPLCYADACGTAHAYLVELLAAANKRTGFTSRDSSGGHS